MSLHSSYGPNPLEDLPLTDPRCNNDSCTAFEAAHNASQAQVSYYLQFSYGHWTTWYYAIVIFVFTVLYACNRYAASKPRRQSPSSSLSILKNKSVAAARYVTYRRFRGPIFDRLGLPSCGLLVLLMLSVLFLCILTFAVRPYYRGHRGYGSPPLAIRTGLMAAACTPLLVALSGKANLITLLTGIGHERLNVVHQWVAYMCLGLSVVHTIPFIVAPLRDGGYAALHNAFYEPGAYEYTGVPPLSILIAFALFSLPFLRHRFYESFYFLHIALFIVYLPLCFWHFDNEGDSWAYLWASLAIWLATLLARVLWFNRAFNLKGIWMIGSPIEMQELLGAMTLLKIWAPPEVTWKPGQHFFLRVPGVEILGNHPFTIANACQDISRRGEYPEKIQTSKERLVKLYIRSHKGFTKKLAARAQSELNTVGMGCWLEGPYGGIPYAVENMVDRIVLVAGGGGVTACLPLLEHLTRKAAAGLEMRTTSVRFVWIVRRPEHLGWADGSVEEAKHVIDQEDGFLETIFYVTGDTTGHEVLQSDLEIGSRGAVSPQEAAEKAHDGINERDVARIGARFKLGRPRIADIIPSLIAEAGRTLIVGCGPESLKTDLSNVCAQLQVRVLRGEVESVALHTETFGW